ncbi:hypothetical protein MED217_14820 [Leeuwenhoekiella blandensis MED217]|uniref:Uncharacterized protein n=1 Tax=Leeuwenhoekiella blandensis (strain CECT 7118 / CCUG 51940 / KCTC 22103 / MED217) TaxID=398720 RepID=A3XGC4_LEEBM|nr:hypothetical protein MED217_14820 [Leeuwenhoekiella blandensis MED217]
MKTNFQLRGKPWSIKPFDGANKKGDPNASPFLVF